jgi:spermidine synthase
MAPGGVIVATTFSHSVLYDHESATYHEVFGPFFNLKLENRIVLGRKGGIAPDDRLSAGRNAAALEAEFRRQGVSTDYLLTLMNPAMDWDTDARILTDQYSPSNLLNAMPRPK